MKTVMKFVIVVIVSIMMIGCTDNYRAKHYGGTMKIDLEPSQKLVDVTWKGNSLWYMTKPMSETDIAETYTFKEESGFGLVEGKVIFIESK
jgi:uncharacterized lipoprotein YehR (DUF1307 family)